jgi:hypothetical protein
MPEASATAACGYFLSYSRSDERFALRFAKDLRSHGVAVWVDQFDIRPSEHWDRAIERAVRDCRGLVVILSPRSVASDNVADEISFAIETGKPVLPIVIERCTLPLRITRMHTIDATANYERALQQCLAEIRRGSETTDAAAPEPATPRAALDAETLATTKQHLTSIVGPIAGILVDKAAARAASVKDFYSELATHIDNEADRERFASLTSSQTERPHPAAEPPGHAPAAAKASQISREDIDRIAKILTTYLGPIAPIMTKRESQTAASIKELRQRLALLIPDERERADFCKRVEAHQ